MTRGTKRPTPYDKKIAELSAKGHAQGGLDRFESELRVALGNKQEGYLAAVADHADLLAAAESLIEVCDKGRPFDFVILISKVCEQTRAALVKHKRGTP